MYSCFGKVERDGVVGLRLSSCANVVHRTYSEKCYDLTITQWAHYMALNTQVINFSLLFSFPVVERNSYYLSN
jgi:hypothetical protein